MRTFSYKAVDAAGRSASGLIEAGSLKEARERLAARGWMAEQMAPVESGRPERRRAHADLGRSAVRSMIYREMSAMLRAGLPVAKALNLIIDSPEHRGAREQLAHIRDRIREGDTPSAAFSTSGALTPLETAALEAGQRAGALEISFGRLATFLETSQQAADRARTALMYPAFVAVFAVLVAAGLLGFLLPSFAKIWSDARIDLPWLTQAMMGAVRWTRWLAPPVLLGLVFVVAWFRKKWRTSESFRARMERQIARLPVLGDTWMTLMAARFARTFHMLLNGGIPLVEALGMAGDATGSAWVGGQVRRETESVRHGGRVADMLRRIPALSSGLAGWVEAGEASGELERMIEPAAERLQQAWERRLQRSVALIEPAVIILLGGLVLLIALSVILPILKLNAALGQ